VPPPKAAIELPSDFARFRRGCLPQLVGQLPAERLVEHRGQSDASPAQLQRYVLLGLRYVGFSSNPVRSWPRGSARTIVVPLRLSSHLPTRRPVAIAQVQVTIMLISAPGEG
jgi:hypothetical protein